MSLFRPRVLAAALAFAAAGASAHTNERGIDPQNFDESAGACADFFQHANGGWLKSNPIPPEYSQWSLDDELRERNLAMQREILEGAAKNPADPGSDARKIGDFYASAMDESAVNAAGYAPIRERLAHVDALKTSADVAALIRAWHAEGIPTLFDFGPEADMKNASMVIAYATQGGLGMPDRDYYLRTDAKSKALLEKYRTHVARMLALVDRNERRRRGRLGARSRDAPGEGLARSGGAARTGKLVPHLHRQGRRREDAALLVVGVLPGDRRGRCRAFLARAARFLRRRRQRDRDRARRALAGVSALASGQLRRAVAERCIRRRRFRFLRQARCAAPRSSSRAGSARSRRPTKRSASRSAKRTSRACSRRRRSSAPRSSSPISRRRCARASASSTGWPTRRSRPPTPSSTR